MDQVVMSPRTPSAVIALVATYNSSFAYNAPIAYNAASVGSGGVMSQRPVAVQVMDSRIVQTSIMNAR